MDIFDLRDQVIRDYGSYVRSFLTIRDTRVDELVQHELERGFLWPEPLIQLNPSFEPGESLPALVDSGLLHPECLNIFRAKGEDGSMGDVFRFHRHQVESIQAARAGDNYVLTTGTGSGKSLSYIVPIVDHVLRRGSGKGIQAIVVYPMNALANSQVRELEKFLCLGYPKGKPPVTFRRYTGQETDEERKEIIASPPDILLTNYVMLELVLTRPWDHQLVGAAKGLRFLVLDELHTYRGRQGADVSLLVRRVREACKATDMLHVGTSATLAGGGTWSEQQQEVAALASNLFGSEVKPNRVIGETLLRATPEREITSPAFVTELRTRLEEGTAPPPGDTRAFLADPLACWIESTLGIRDVRGRLERCIPRPVSGPTGAAAALAERTGVVQPECEEAICHALQQGYLCHNEHGRPLFAFRLHQFVSKGESVYASPEPEQSRHLTLQAQQFVPGTGRKTVLLPIAFCRECGQDYYVVRRARDDGGQWQYLPRQVTDRLDNDDGDAGYLYLSTASPWPHDPDEVMERIPEAWLESGKGGLIVRKNQRQYLPQKVTISSAAVEGAGDQPAWWMPASFRFCLCCGVSYHVRGQSSDFGKLTTLGSEGRSTATTVLTLSTIRKLRAEPTLKKQARKLLSFTDNRQDASLQAGHFNDFVEIALLRAGLWRAVASAGAAGIHHETLTQRVFEALELPIDLYAADPGVKYAAREETDRALREALGYYLYRDLRRGWRVTSPNLEQCGLLDIDYMSLGEFCANPEEWDEAHPTLASASAADRERVCRVLLDYLRRELVLRVNYLDPPQQEAILQLSRQRLISPWGLDSLDKLEPGRTVLPGPQTGQRERIAQFVYLSPRGGYGLYLKRKGTFRDLDAPLTMKDVDEIIPALCRLLCVPGILHQTLEPRQEGDLPGYQLNASALIWRPGSGDTAFHDHIRVPREPEGGLRTNPFFKEFYRAETSDLKQLEAREHTAQVDSRVREEREDAFRDARLPILYCSPTMELGVDIAELNVVNIRNVPPTPANYAQRSGRAGRSGQPAFVYSYCAAGSPHDQYFFKRPERMVAGSVTTPRLDLTNEDLLKSHVHAIWLSCANISLGSSLDGVLDVSGDDPSLAVIPELSSALHDPRTRQQASAYALAALGSTIEQLVAPESTPEEWIGRVLAQVPASFDASCQRWRDLYRAALSQSKRQSRVILDSSREKRDRDSAKRLRAEAEAQLRLLLETSSSRYSDFYSYRYFASEGFLPGYNFPRLPLSAFLPGRRKVKDSDEFLTRPRFLAISEFGPRSIVYHEGSRYIINKVILPVEEGDDCSIKRRAVQCGSCGYIHPLEDQAGPDLCESCEAKLPPPMSNLFRMQNVAARRRDRISSDEEERLRLGYEMKTGIRFATREGVVSARQATIRAADGRELATLVYGDAATIWRMNLGWRRRKSKDQLGYVLDVERGFWERNQAVDDDPDDPMSHRVERVVPYVEDARNCMVVRLAEDPGVEVMASLEAALKVAVQVHFQLEDRELATEGLPTPEERRQILLYEAAEGGAGVLRRLVEDPGAIPALARVALDLCHFHPDTGEDQRRSPRSNEDCEAACYNCLLSYFNQRDHRLVDRQLLPELLLAWANGQVDTSPAPLPRGEQVQRLLNLCDSELERRWVRMVDDLGLRLPDRGQPLLRDQRVRPDFMFVREMAAVFIDGPHHDKPKQRATDADQEELLINSGHTVHRFHHAADWKALLAGWPDLFGRIYQQTTTSGFAAVADGGAAGETVTPDPQPRETGFDVEDFDEEWRPLLQALAERPDVEVEPSNDVMHEGRVIGADLATIRRGDLELRLGDSRSGSSAEVASALTSSGCRVCELDPSESTNEKRVLDALTSEDGVNS